MYRATLVLVGLVLLPPAARADKLVLVAGGGSKDGNCPATDAKLNTPFGVDFDKAGNMYIVDALNQELSQFERIKKIRLLPREFSIESGELTPSLKIRRKAIEQNWRQEIEEIYGAP